LTSIGPECSVSLGQMAGPMWSGPIHDSDFVAKVLDHLESHQNHYGTSPRMKGMLTVAKEVLLSLSIPCKLYQFLI
jgi:tRNA (guanine26-N2/guanine27-N2)-dimethyltransferase